MEFFDDWRVKLDGSGYEVLDVHAITGDVRRMPSEPMTELEAWTAVKEGLCDDRRQLTEAGLRRLAELAIEKLNPAKPAPKPLPGVAPVK